MKKLSLLALVALSFSAFAAPIETSIHKILAPEKGETEYVILATDGKVYDIDAKDEELVDLAYEAMETNSTITIDLNNLSIVNGIMNRRKGISEIQFISNEVPEFAPMDVEFAPGDTPLTGYTVSTLADMNTAKRYFSTMQGATKWRSQCYNRAHVWSYEMKTDHNINTGKMWIFFSAKYIKEYKYKWWFHVAPYVQVATEREPVVLDREFSRVPQRLTDWKNVYMKNNATCVNTESYTTYEDNTWNEYCFLIQSSMYYWQPFNLENLDKEGTTKSGFVSNELKRAYSNAIKGRYRRDVD